MSKITKRSLTVSALVMGLIATSAYAGIANTRHNLSTSEGRSLTQNQLDSSTYLDAVSRSATDEICVFCHTPHASSTTLVAPLWNKALPNYTSYTMYSSGTMQGSASFTSGSASLACLSCHDGTQAMDNMINQPGSSGFNSSGAALGNMGTMSTSTIANLGTDLSNDHPVGIPYCGGGQSQEGINTGCADTDFFPARKMSTGTNVDSYGVSTDTSRPYREWMRLYGTTLSSATVECASCHDPHTENKTFLRLNNSGSAVCLTCHNK